MKRILYSSLLVFSLLAACTQPQQQVSRHAPASNAQNQYAADGQDCNGTAKQKLSLYDKPGAYPLSDKERSDAYNALFSECMKEHNWQVAGQTPSAANANVASAADLAALSPSAGTPSSISPAMNPPASLYPPGVVVIDTGHLNSGTYNANGKPGASSPGVNVIVVGAQSAPIPVAPPQALVASAPPAQPAQPVIIGSGPVHTPSQPVIIGGPAPHLATTAPAQPTTAELAAYSPSAGTPDAAPAPTANSSAELEHIITKTE